MSSRKFFQKTNKWIPLYHYATCFCLFFGEIEDTKKTFRNYLTFTLTNKKLLFLKKIWAKPYGYFLNQQMAPLMAHFWSEDFGPTYVFCINAVPQLQSSTAEHWIHSTFVANVNKTNKSWVFWLFVDNPHILPRSFANIFPINSNAVVPDGTP